MTVGDAPATFKYYEVNEYGEIIMTARPTNDHQRVVTAVPFVPDLCVEVLSRGNTKEELAMKVNAYLRGGAREVLVVGLRGEVEIFGAEGKRSASALGINLRLPVSLF
jgi:hypothetical protein